MLVFKDLKDLGGFCSLQSQQAELRSGTCKTKAAKAHEKGQASLWLWLSGVIASGELVLESEVGSPKSKAAPKNR